MKIKRYIVLFEAKLDAETRYYTHHWGTKARVDVEKRKAKQMGRRVLSVKRVTFDLPEGAKRSQVWD